VDTGVVEVRAFFDLADRAGGKARLEVRPDTNAPTVGSVAEQVGVPGRAVGFAMINGCVAGLDARVAPGDRVALFPDYVPYHKVYGTCVI
jgi:molybdopterin converting factor small subunit